ACQDQVQPDVHRRGAFGLGDPPPLGKGRGGATSNRALPSAADARITTRTARPTTYVLVSVAPKPAAALVVARIGHDVLAMTTISKASRAAVTAAPTIHSRLKGSWVDSSPAVWRSRPTRSAALTVVKTSSWAANNRKGAI